MIAVVATFVLGSNSHAKDSSLFERDGFRIHYVSNGGNCNGCEWIAIDGSIPPDAGQLFQQYVETHKFAGLSLTIALNSEGGSLTGAIRLGRVIRSLGMKTRIAKTVPNENWHTEAKGVCLSACAYAFLGGVFRSANAGEYGLHQFYTDALLKDPNGKVFTPVDFSIQQALTGLLLAYVIEMGIKAELVVAANKTAPTEMNLLTREELAEFRVIYDPKEYGEWKLEAYRRGLLAYSRTQDEKQQMTVFCDGSHNAKMLVTYSNSQEGYEAFRDAFNAVKKFSLLKRDLPRPSIKLAYQSGRMMLHVPLTSPDLDALENNNDPYGSFSVHSDEPRVFYGLVYERISLRKLADSIRLVRRNCLN